MSKVGKLIYTKGEDWVYLTGIPISDPSIGYVTSKGKKQAVFGALELPEARAHATVDEVIGFDDLRHKAMKISEKPTLVEVIQALLNEDVAETVQVAADFPAYLFEKLVTRGVPLVPVEDFVFPERAVKTEQEIERIREAQALNEVGFKRARAVLAEAEVGAEDVLMWQGKMLTSETLRCEMMQAMLAEGEFPMFPSGEAIVTCGDQSADVHSKGSGVLRANRFIIIDSFPRHPNHYCGDLTRTYFKGQPDAWHKDVYNAVLEAQEMAVGMIAAGVDGADVQKAVEESFVGAGFATGKSEKGDYYGFFHGTGHSLGLAVHDGGPRMLTRGPCELKPGYVTTVEPGLYYPPGTHEGGAGGCRIEDIVVVRDGGCENLTELSKSDWIVD